MRNLWDSAAIDGNGLELYWDRAPADWPRNPDGTLPMYTRKLDVDALLAEAQNPPT